MSKQTATGAALTIDKEECQTRQLVNRLFYLIQPYIADTNQRNVMGLLYEFYTNADITLISKTQLKQYQEMEKLILATSPLEIKNG